VPAAFFLSFVLLRHLLFPAPVRQGPSSPSGAVSFLGGGDAPGFERALEPRPFRFPEDHGPHPSFRHEWWYFTGNLDGEGGRRFGYQLTFFRFALAPPGGARRTSDLAAREAWMAHLAVTDGKEGTFRRAERFSRGGGALAGAEVRPAAGGGEVRVWLDDWSVSGGEEGPFPARLRAFSGDFGVELDLVAGEPPVLQGDRGWSRKGEGKGNASYYYSLPRVATRGTVRSGGRDLAVAGTTWVDREWGTSALSPRQAGWDWFSLNLSDGRDLMYYRLRGRGGETDRHSAGSLSGGGGPLVRLGAEDVRIEETGRWRSPATGVEYPSGWRLVLPAQRLALVVSPLLEGQEWDGAVRYWEGAVDAQGSGPGGKVTGRGYAELAGYGDGGAPPGR
jgi:predicted secreted hydrolase